MAAADFDLDNEEGFDPDDVESKRVAW